MTHRKPPRLTVPADGTTDEIRDALQRLRRQQLARTAERERSGKPPRPDELALAREARQQQFAVELGARIVPITETDIDCMDELVRQLADETTDD